MSFLNLTAYISSHPETWAVLAGLVCSWSIAWLHQMLSYAEDGTLTRRQRAVVYITEIVSASISCFILWAAIDYLFGDNHREVVVNAVASVITGICSPFIHMVCQRILNAWVNRKSKSNEAL